MPLCVALVHYPVVNKQGKVVCASLTNYDVHDIARACRTFEVDRYFLVTPSEPQQWLARRIIRHWDEGWGKTYNPNRREALTLIEVVADLGEVSDRCQALWGDAPVTIGTSARRQRSTITTADLRLMLRDEEKVHCLVFGTGWGLHPTLMADLDFSLEPICGPGDYNHLSVRAAVAITLDRLRGARTPSPEKA
jgi:hypothetical protein